MTLVESAPPPAGPSAAASGRRFRVLRVIARMNLGGPAHHVSLLSGRLDPERYETLLVSGAVGPGEASAEALAHRRGATLETLETLGPELHPVRDLRALLALRGVVRRFRPDIVHTHTAKAGLLGRVAALTAGRPRPAIVHTYHGHVLEGYFGPLRSRLFRLLERWLARASDRLVGVSEATVEDLVRLGVAPRERFAAIPLGLDLEPFLAAERGDRGLRDELGAEPGETVLTFTGRLVPIKRVDRLLRAVARARSAGTAVRLAIVGDGELRGELKRLARQLGVHEVVRFLGYREDLVRIAAGTDVAVLSSDNEGTPVALIEAAAAGVPAVATAVGGVAEVVREGAGLAVPAGDEQALAVAIERLAADPELRRSMGERARAHVRRRYAVERLLADVDRLYEQVLAERAAARRAAPPS